MAFAQSVLPHGSRTLELRTSWGSGFNRDPQYLYEKTCDHGDYQPGKAFCAYLMENTSTEFQNVNFERAASCLSGKAKNLHIGPAPMRGGPPAVLVEVRLHDGEEPSLVFVASSIGDRAGAD
jgi:hypothetical protein